jgi:tripartite motif-containing protein 71
MVTIPEIEYLASFVTWKGGSGSFAKPCGVATDAFQNLYVADAGNCRVQKFDQSLQFIFEVGRGEGPLFRKVGKLSAPIGVVVDLAGSIYIADATNCCIVKYDFQGGFMAQFGREGTKEGELKRPRSLSFDAQKNLWVVDAYNHRLQKFDSEGKFMARLGGKGKEGMVGKFNDPSDLAFDEEECLYITDSKNNQVHKFDPFGKPLLLWGKTGKADGKNGESGRAVHLSPRHRH